MQQQRRRQSSRPCPPYALCPTTNDNSARCQAQQRAMKRARSMQGRARRRSIVREESARALGVERALGVGDDGTGTGGEGCGLGSSGIGVGGEGV